MSIKSMKFCPVCQADLVTTEQDEAIRLTCSSPSCRYVFWNNPTPVVAAIIEFGSDVLLVHNVAWPPKMLGLVSGFLEAEEHPDDAIRREVFEETSLQVVSAAFIGHYAFVEQNQLILAYAVQCTGEISLNEELDSYKLIAPDKLKPWAFGTGPAVRDWLASRLN